MKKLTLQTLLIGALFATFLGAGCGKNADTETTGEAAVGEEGAPAAASSLPGADEAMAALDQKDFDAVVAGLVKAKQSVSNAEQETQFANLVDDVKIRLLEEAPTSPKATEALAALRAMTGGR